MNDLRAFERYMVDPHKPYASLTSRRGEEWGSPCSAKNHTTRPILKFCMQLGSLYAVESTLAVNFNSFRKVSLGGYGRMCRLVVKSLHIAIQTYMIKFSKWHLRSMAYFPFRTALKVWIIHGNMTFLRLKPHGVMSAYEKVCWVPHRVSVGNEIYPPF